MGCHVMFTGYDIISGLKTILQLKTLKNDYENWVF